MVRRRRQAGFTLLELIIVVTMIGILASIAVPALMQMPRRAKESVLKTNLRAIREAIEQHYGDRGRYPATLDALVPKYLKTVPLDPFTKAADWTPVYEAEPEDGTPLFAPDEEEAGPGIQDIHSSSPDKGLDATPYATW
jgi:general secretion pathway protein G